MCLTVIRDAPSISRWASFSVWLHKWLFKLPTSGRTSNRLHEKLVAEYTWATLRHPALSYGSWNQKEEAWFFQMFRNDCFLFTGFDVTSCFLFWNALLCDAQSTHSFTNNAAPSKTFLSSILFYQQLVFSHFSTEIVDFFAFIFSRFMLWNFSVSFVQFPIKWLLKH